MRSTNLVKKAMFTLVMVLVACSVGAQEKGDMAAGLNLAYGTKSGFSNFGIGAKYQYSFTDNFRIEPSATYFLKKDYVSMWDINANVHYLFHVGENFVIYPLAGLTFVGWKADFGDLLGELEEEYGVNASQSVTKFGANLGAGAQYWLTRSFGLNLEVKYQIVSDISRPVFSLGAVFKF